GELQVASVDGSGIRSFLPSTAASETFLAVNTRARLALTAPNNLTAHLWRLDDPDAPTVLRGHTDRVIRGFFAASGARIVTTDVLYSIRLWDTASATTVFVGPSRTPWDITPTVSPDGSKVAFSSQKQISETLRLVQIWI